MVVLALGGAGGGPAAALSRAQAGSAGGGAPEVPRTDVLRAWATLAIEWVDGVVVLCTHLLQLRSQEANRISAPSRWLDRALGSTQSCL